MLAARERGFLAQVGLYLFEAAALGLSNQGLDEDEGEQPTVKVTAARRMRLRLPRRSERGPALPAAPSKIEATTSPPRNGVSPSFGLMNRIAPEMTPVS